MYYNKNPSLHISTNQIKNLQMVNEVIEIRIHVYNVFYYQENVHILTYTFNKYFLSFSSLKLNIFHIQLITLGTVVSYEIFTVRVWTIIAYMNQMCLTFAEDIIPE